MTEQNIKLPASLAQAIADYLSTRPYREVVGLIEGMKRAPIEKPDGFPDADGNLIKTNGE